MGKQPSTFVLVRIRCVLVLHISYFVAIKLASNVDQMWNVLWQGIYYWIIRSHASFNTIVKNEIFLAMLFGTDFHTEFFKQVSTHIVTIFLIPPKDTKLRGHRRSGFAA